MLSVACIKCAVVFEYEPRGGRLRKYCSPACRSGEADRSRGCIGCGAELTGHGWKWCSGACRARTLLAAETAEQREHRLQRGRERQRVKRGKAVAGIPVPRCQNCNDVKINSRGRFCGKQKCQTAAYRERRAKAVPCSVDGCESPMQGKGLCGTHYAAMWRAKNMDKYRAKNHRYRASKKTAAVGENVSPQVVFETDGWRCHICRKKIDKRLKFPDQMSASLDHVIPLSKGGEHSYENCRASHFICNSTKRDLGAGDQMMLIAVKAKVVKHGRSGTAA